MVDFDFIQGEMILGGPERIREPQKGGFRKTWSIQAADDPHPLSQLLALKEPLARSLEEIISINEERDSEACSPPVCLPMKMSSADALMEP